MKLITLLTGLLLMLLAGCATSIYKKQLTCENLFTKFDEVVNCTKQSFLVDHLGRSTDLKVEVYLSKADLLVEKLKSGDMTELEAKTKMENAFFETAGKKNTVSEANARNYNTIRFRQKHCMPTGKSMECPTF